MTTELLQEIADTMRWVVILLGFIGGSVFGVALVLVFKRDDA